MRTSGGSLRATLAAFAAACVLSALLPVNAQAKERGVDVTPRVVVAVIDSGINAYHEYFNARGSLYKKSAPSSVTPAVLKEFGIGKSNVIQLTRTGNFPADFAKDKPQFNKIKKGEPYWFAGTNIIGISFKKRAPLRPDGDADSHGTTPSMQQRNPWAALSLKEHQAFPDRQ